MVTKDAVPKDDSLVRSDVISKLDINGRDMDALVQIVVYDAQSRLSVETQDFERALGTDSMGMKCILDKLTKRGLLEYTRSRVPVKTWGTDTVYSFKLTAEGRRRAALEISCRIDGILDNERISVADGSISLREAGKLLYHLKPVDNELKALRKWSRSAGAD